MRPARRAGWPRSTRPPSLRRWRPSHRARAAGDRIRLPVPPTVASASAQHAAARAAVTHRYGEPMDVGIQTVFASYGWPGITDGQVYDEETRLALLADELGFDVVWAVEHHFYDYSFCPDNTEWLAYIAGRTKNIDVGTAAVIMSWNEPLRVAERVALLDHLTKGRFRCGMVSGLSRREFGSFGIGMDESRERFDEGS